MPTFVLDGYKDMSDICRRHSIELFAIDKWNYSHMIRNSNYTVPAEEQFRVVAQSQRLLLLQQLSTIDRLTLANTIYSRCVKFLKSKRMKLFDLEHYLILFQII